jgi:hypothetical protein
MSFPGKFVFRTTTAESLQLAGGGYSASDKAATIPPCSLTFTCRRPQMRLMGANTFSPKGGVMIQRLVVAGLLCALLAGCGGPTIDGTSDQTFKDSWAVITKGMSKKDENKFRMACFTVAATKGGGAAAEANASQESQLRLLNGMSKDQITAEAASIIEKNKQRRK